VNSLLQIAHLSKLVGEAQKEETFLCFFGFAYFLASFCIIEAIKDAIILEN
jgi:hypothetical protein